MKAFLSLTFLKALDSLSPLILVPFAINIFNIEGFGRISFYQTLAVFFAYLIDLGFNVVGIQRITATPVGSYIKAYLTSSYLIRLILFLLMVPLFIGVSLLSPIYRPEDLPIIISYTLLLLSAVLASVWYFQAKGEYRILLMSSFLSRFVFISLIVIFVDGMSDITLYVIMYTCMFLVPAIFQFSIIIKRGLSKKLNYRLVALIAKENLDISLYRFSNAIILPLSVYTISIVATANEVGLFTVFQRILGVLVNISLPINQSLVPHLAKLKKNTIGKFYTKALKFYCYVVAISVVLVTAVYLGVLVLVQYNYFSNYSNNLAPLLITSLIVITVVPHFANSYVTQTIKLIGVSRINKNVSSMTVLLIGITLASAVYFNSYSTIILGYVLTYILSFVFLSVSFVRIANKRRLG
ncbi:lipopolysaccharide biosynthesis protein [Cobetia marina]|uniref:lipopolysaccharide biosynthesis protein n=1 Tax=Cobetia marina TaxID=28258 RepID=UPI000A003E72|nr:oligosaccharide flippase family protein [Cobetia marina]